MTSGNLLPSLLLVLFLASNLGSTDVLSVRQITPQAGLHIILITLSDPEDTLGQVSDAFESSLHLGGLAENARSSLFRFATRCRVAVESLRARLEIRVRSVSKASFAERSGLRSYD